MLAGYDAHGGNLDAVSAEYGIPVDEWVDLSTGINPRPYPHRTLSDEAFTRLPSSRDVEALALAVSRYCDAPDSVQAVPASGSQALIAALAQLRAGEALQVDVVWPTYHEHEACWREAGHRVRRIATMADATGDVVVVTNPNNPDGRLVPDHVLKEAAAACKRRGAWLVVDEAFMDCTPDRSAIDLAGAHVCVLRSFGKFFGLAGVRVGVAFTNEPVASRLRTHCGPWPVPGPGLEIAIRAYQDDAWCHATREWLAGQTEAFHEALIAADVPIVGSTNLFTLIDAPEGAFETLAARGIFVRRFRDYPSWLRIGLPGDDDVLTQVVDGLASCARIAVP